MLLARHGNRLHLCSIGGRELLKRLAQSIKPPLRQLLTLARGVAQHFQWGAVYAGHSTLLSVVHQCFDTLCADVDAQVHSRWPFGNDRYCSLMIDILTSRSHLQSISIGAGEMCPCAN